MSTVQLVNNVLHVMVNGYPVEGARLIAHLRESGLLVYYLPPRTERGLAVPGRYRVDTIEDVTRYEDTTAFRARTLVEWEEPLSRPQGAPAVSAAARTLPDHFNQYLVEEVQDAVLKELHADGTH